MSDEIRRLAKQVGALAFTARDIANRARSGNKRVTIADLESLAESLEMVVEAFGPMVQEAAEADQIGASTDEAAEQTGVCSFCGERITEGVIYVTWGDGSTVAALCGDDWCDDTSHRWASEHCFELRPATAEQVARGNLLQRE